MLLKILIQLINTYLLARRRSRCQHLWTHRFMSLAHKNWHICKQLKIHMPFSTGWIMRENLYLYTIYSQWAVLSFNIGTHKMMSVELCCTIWLNRSFWIIFGYKEIWWKVNLRKTTHSITNVSLGLFNWEKNIVINPSVSSLILHVENL